MRRYFILFFFISFLFFSFLLWFFVNLSPFKKEKSEVDFIVPKGMSAYDVGRKLYKEGLIKNPLAFKMYVQFTGKSKKIKAGGYRLSPSFSIPDLVERLAKGPEEVWVTIPEGWRREQVALRLANELKSDKKEKELFIREFLENTEGLEGYLFPDTYLFPRQANASFVISLMRKNFDEKVKDLRDRKSNLYSFDKLLILASIVEREAKNEEERPIIAGILLKRIKAGIPLQVDATVQYAKSTRDCRGNVECDWWPKVRKEDLGIDSFFNTYKYRGFPPSPISNPGLSSLKAVFHPQETNFLFYLHDKEGKVYFAQDYEEHLRNIEKYLKE